jgi:hypothetical protein
LDDPNADIPTPLEVGDYDVSGEESSDLADPLTAPASA